MVKLVSLVVVAACATPHTVVCDDDRVCPEGTRCVQVHPSATDVVPPGATLVPRCVSPEQIANCDGKAPDAECGDMQRCYDGVCLVAGCGNGRLDPLANEVCDDGNAVTGDGCSAGCTSREVCGNGILDPVTQTPSGAVPREQCDDANLVGHDGCASDCQPEAFDWELAIDDTPGRRFDATIGYDPIRDRVVMVGGVLVEQVTPFMRYDDLWEWDGGGWRSRVLSPRPTIHQEAAIAFDGTRRSMIMFGGVFPSGTESDDTWAYDGSAWTILHPATRPPARQSALLAADPARKRLVLYGGYAAPSVFSVDTWEWDGQNWFASPDGPALPGAAMAFDPTRAMMIVVGGGQTWAYDGAWHPIGTVPAQLVSPQLAFDPRTGVVLAVSASESSVDTWRLDGAIWSRVSTATSPTPRSEPQLVATNLGLVLFGGAVIGGSACNTTACPFLKNDTWTWNGATWAQASTAVPSTYGAAAAFDPVRHLVWLFGGKNAAGTTVDDFWLGTADHWVSFPVTRPSPRLDAAMVLTPRGLVLFGGATTRFDTSNAETWTFDSSWHAIAGTGPPPRSGAAMVYDHDRDRVVLFGGFDASAATFYLGDTWEWDGASWTHVTPVHSPPARMFGAIAYDPIRRRTVLHGGADRFNSINSRDDTWEWDGTDWTQVATVEDPVIALDHAMVWDAARRELELVDEDLGLVWELDRAGPRWRVLATARVVPSRQGAAIVPDPEGAGLVMFGGRTAGQVVTERWHARFGHPGPYESCAEDLDLDGDGLAGCQDPDCWAACTPWCPPGATCDPTAPHCGDGTCFPGETCRSCPADCACTPVCGDTYCDPGETHAACPGDCP